MHQRNLGLTAVAAVACLVGVMIALPDEDSNSESATIGPSGHPAEEVQAAIAPSDSTLGQREPEPVPLEFGEQALDVMMERYGRDPMPYDSELTPLALADQIARDNTKRIFETPQQALLSSLSQRRAQEVLDCMGRRSYPVEGGGAMNGIDLLQSHSTTASMDWEPLGRYWAEIYLMYDGLHEEKAKEKYSRTLLKRHMVDPMRPFEPQKSLTFRQAINPDGKALGEDEWEIIQFVLQDHEQTIRDLILNNGLFEAQLSARKDLIARGAYEAVPGVAFGTIENCDSRLQEHMSLKVAHCLNGWMTYMVAMKGEYPLLDTKLMQLQEAVNLRNQQLKEYVASF